VAREQVKVDVLIAGDKDTSYQRIIHAMDLVRAAGIEAVALTTSTP
jgi:biopolymer transport protein ExbD